MGEDLDLIAASLRADLTDLDSFVEGLAAKLEQICPTQATVQRSRRGLRGPKLVNRIELQTDAERFVLERSGGGLSASRGRVSGGIVLKTERLDPGQWIDAVTAALAELAGRSEQTRLALERLLLDG